MIYVFVGTRAQLIKMAPIILELEKNKIKYTYVSTAQHADTMEELHADFGISKPHFFLSKVEERKSVSALIFWFFKIIWNALRGNSPWFTGKGIGLVHGDTLSTLLSALLLKINGNKVAHVESGLRSHNLLNPFPEEMVRLLTFRLSDIYFCQDETALRNVAKYPGHKYDTKVNTLADSIQIIESRRIINHGEVLEKYCLISFHRFENLNSPERLRFILSAVEMASTRLKTYLILHPTTQKKLESHPRHLQKLHRLGVTLLPRMPFSAFIHKLSRAEFLLTDGGSNQEEASYLGIPCGILRLSTERLEGLEKNAVLLGFDTQILNAFLSSVGYRVRGTLPSNKPSRQIVHAINQLCANELN